MGGHQANKAQATSSFNQGSQAAGQEQAAGQQSQALGTQYNAQQQALFKTLFGTGGPSGGGTLSRFMSPSSLNVTTPQGPEKLAYANTVGDIAQGFNNARGSLARSLANQGFGANSPAYFGAAENANLGAQQAQAQGQAYQQATEQSYQNALNNFWGATNLASGAMGQGESGALQGTSGAAAAYGGAGDTMSRFYGTAGQYVDPFAQIMSAAIQAGGNVGAAAVKGGGGCWIAAVVFNEDFYEGPRVTMVRAWLSHEFARRGRWQNYLVSLYGKHGQRASKVVARSSVLRWVFRKIFDRALESAVAWRPSAPMSSLHTTMSRGA